MARTTAGAYPLIAYQACWYHRLSVYVARIWAEHILIIFSVYGFLKRDEKKEDWKLMELTNTFNITYTPEKFVNRKVIWLSQTYEGVKGKQKQAGAEVFHLKVYTIFESVKNMIWSLEMISPRLCIERFFSKIQI